MGGGGAVVVHKEVIIVEAGLRGLDRISTRQHAGIPPAPALDCRIPSPRRTPRLARYPPAAAGAPGAW